MVNFTFTFTFFKNVDGTVFWSLNGNRFSDQKKEGHGGISLVYRSLWKPAKGKKVEVAMKILKPACTDKYLKVMNVLDEQSQPVCCRFARARGFFSKVLINLCSLTAILTFQAMPFCKFPFNNQPDALIIQIYSVIKLYMFRASSLPIIRSFLLYIRHW